MKSFRLLLLLAVFSLSPGAGAETLFINDATVYTMQSQGIMHNADLLLRDGRVQALGSDLVAPADATTIEAGGRPLTPGFFAGITQLGLMEIEMVESTVDGALAGQDMRPEFDVAPAYNPFSTAIPVSRIEGMTWTVLGATRSGSIIAGQGRPVLFDGGYHSFIGDRVLFVDVGGDASGQSGNSRAAQWMLLEQAMAEARSELQWSPGTLLTPAGRNVLADFRSSGLIVFDADRASDILQVLAFCERHGLRPVIAGGAEAWMVADRLAEAGVPVLIDALANLPENFDSIGARLDNAAILHEAGVTLAFSGVETHQARKLRQLAGNAVANGLPYEAGLAAMTVNPARIFDLGDSYGTISTDSRADLVLWSGDPLEVTTAADQVIVGGRAIDMVSRQTLLRDRYLETNPDLPRAYIKP